LGIIGTEMAYKVMRPDEATRGMVGIEKRVKE
jgi:hypothetical protein